MSAMVTTGPIPPLAETQWIQGTYAVDDGDQAVAVTRATRTCMLGWLARHGLDERGDVLQQVNLALLAAFPDRVEETDSCEDQIAGFNDHGLTTYADVAKVLDEANRRLA